MDEDPLFTEAFFAYLNTDPEKIITAEEKKALDDQIRKQIYAVSELGPIYYTGLNNNLVQLQGDPQYSQLQNQLYIISNHIQSFFSGVTIQPEIPSLGLLTFFERITQPQSDHATIFYKETGKKKLEEIAILLNDETLDILRRKKIIQEFLANDGLAQCLDNCYFLVNEVNLRLKSLKNSKGKIYHLLRNYITDVAYEVAARRPFALPRSYQQILCDLNGVSTFSHELHARNYFLMYAKEYHFPVNVLKDVIAENMGRVFPDFRLQRSYIHELSASLTADHLITYLSEQFHKSFLHVAADKQNTYAVIQRKLSAKLDGLGIDENFNWHEILYFQDETTLVKPEDSFRITITERLIQRNWLKRPTRWNDVEVSNKYYFYYYFPKNIQLSWIESFDEKEKIMDRYLLTSLLRPEYIYTLSREDKQKLCEKIIADPKFIVHIEDLNTILSIAPSFISQIDNTILRNILIENNDIKNFIHAISRLPIAQGKLVFQEIPPLFIEQLLVNAFSQSDISKKFSFLPQSYFLENEFVKQDVLSITRSLIVGLINQEYHNFYGISFPKLATVNYLNNVNFIYCNLNYAQFHPDLTNVLFDYAKLDGAIFYGRLERVSFDYTDLRKTNFIYKETANFLQVTLEKTRLSTEVFRSLVKFGLRDFISTHLQEVNFQQFRNKKKLKINLSYSDLEGVDLSHLDLRECRFFNVNLKDANLQGTFFRSKYINEFIEIEGAQFTIQVLDNFYKGGVKSFDSCYILGNDIFNEELDNKLSFKKTTFKHAQFIGGLSNVAFIECDLTDAYFGPERGYPIASLNEIAYKKSKLLRTKFSSIKFSNTQIVDCSLQNLIFKDVKLPATTLFALYQQGHHNFRGVRGLKGTIPERLPPFPLAGGKLSEEVFIHLYRQGLRDFRASNLRGFYLAGTLQREAIPEIELKLEGAHYKKFPISCSFSTGLSSKMGRSSEVHLPVKCIFYFFIQTKLPKKEMLSLAEMSEIASQKMAESNTIQSTAVIRAIALDHKPLWRLKNIDELHFYWQSLPDQDDLMKIVSFTKKSIHRKRRADTQIFYYFNNFINAPHVLDNFGKDVLALGLRQVYLGYLSSKGQPNIFYAGDVVQDVILTDMREHLKKMPRPKPESSIINPVNPGKNKEKPLRMATHIRKVMLNGLRSGVRSGVHYDLAFAFMHFLNTAIVYVNRVSPRVLDEKTKEELKQQIPILVKQEADKRGVSQYQRQITTTVAVQCIERGECFNNELLHTDIIDTLSNLKPDIVQGNAALWKKLKHFFKESGKYLSTHFEKVKNFFKQLNPFNFETRSEDRLTAMSWRPAPPLFSPDFLRRTQAHKSFIAAPGAYMIESFNSQVVIQNLTTKQSWRKAIEFDYVLAYSQSATSFPETEDLRRIYDWYEHPILVEIIRRIEFVFSELGYTPHLDSPFSAEELAGLLYNLWQALDQCGISEQSNPEAIINLLKQVYFIQCVLDDGFLRGDCQCLEAQALQFEEQEALAVRRQKRMVALDRLSQPMFSPTYLINSEQRTTPKTVKIVNNTVGFYLQKKDVKQKKEKGLDRAVLYKTRRPNAEFSQQPFIDWAVQEARNDSTFSFRYTLFSAVLSQFSSEKPSMLWSECTLFGLNHPCNDTNWGTRISGYL